MADELFFLLRPESPAPTPMYGRRPVGEGTGDIESLFSHFLSLAHDHRLAPKKVIDLVLPEVLAKLPRFAWELQRRQALAARYSSLIQASGAPVQLLAVRPDRDCVWAQYTVMVHNRPAVQAALQAAGIPTAVHYPKPLHHQPAYAADCCPNCNPHSISASQRVLSLPMSADLSEADQDLVVAALAQACAAAALGVATV